MNATLLSIIGILAGGLEAKLIAKEQSQIDALTLEMSNTQSTFVQSRDLAEILALTAAMTSLSNVFAKINPAPVK